MANNTIYNIINECTGDSDRDPAGTVGTYVDKADAIKAMKADAQEFYDDAADEADDPETWKKDHPLIVTETEVKFDYDGVEHHWYIDESTIHSKSDESKKSTNTSIVDEMVEHLDIDSLTGNLDSRLECLLDDLAGGQVYDLENDYETDTGTNPKLTYEQEEELKQKIHDKLTDYLKETFTKAAANA